MCTIYLLLSVAVPGSLLECAKLQYHEDYDPDLHRSEDPDLKEVEREVGEILSTHLRVCERPYEICNVHDNDHALPLQDPEKDEEPGKMSREELEKEVEDLREENKELNEQLDGVRAKLSQISALSTGQVTSICVCKRPINVP